MASAGSPRSSIVTGRGAGVGAAGGGGAGGATTAAGAATAAGGAAAAAGADGCGRDTMVPIASVPPAATKTGTSQRAAERRGRPSGLPVWC